MFNIEQILPETKENTEPFIDYYTVEEFPTETVVDARKNINVLMSAAIRIPCKILESTECLQKPMTHAQLAEIYLLSKKSGIEKILLLDNENNSWHVALCFRVKNKNIVSYMDLSTVFTAEFVARFSWEEVYNALLYLVYCCSAFHQNNTRFIHLDNKKLLSEKLTNPGTICGRELQLLFIEDWRKRKIHHSGNMLRMVEDKWSASKSSLGYEDGFKLRPLDLTDLEDKLYGLFTRLLLTQDVVCLDTETTGLDTLQDKLVSVGLAFDTHIGFYLSINHLPPKTRSLVIGEKGVLRESAGVAARLTKDGIVKYTGYHDKINQIGSNGDNLGDAYLREVLVPYLLKKKITAHNFKFDYSILLTNTGFRFPIYYDTMLAHYIARPGYDDPFRDKRGLKFIAVQELGVEDWKADIAKCQCEEKDLVAAYNCRDCCYTLGITHLLYEDVMKTPKLFFDIEIPFVELLAHAEREGICLDVKALKKVEDDLLVKMQDIETSVKKSAGDENFNIASVPQLSKLFFEDMGIKPIRKCRKCTVSHQTDSETCLQEGCDGETPVKRLTPGGKPALDKIALEDLADAGVELAQQITDHRAAAKLVGTYTCLDEKCHPLDMRLHPTYHQARTATGRLSSANPNFQQLPKKSGKLIRSCIIPQPGHCLVAADYAGQEIRILAAYSGDEKLITAYNPCFRCPENKDPLKRCHLNKGSCPSEDHSDVDSRCNVMDIHSFITKQVHPEIEIPISAIKESVEWGIVRDICKGVTFALNIAGALCCEAY